MTRRLNISEVIDPNSESGARVLANLAKASTQPDHKGFAALVSKATGIQLAGSVKVTDSAESISLPVQAPTAERQAQQETPIAASSSSDAPETPAPSEARFTAEQVQEMLLTVATRAAAQAVEPLQQERQATQTEIEELRAAREAEAARATQLEQELEQARSQASANQANQELLRNLNGLLGRSDTTTQSPVHMPNTNTRLASDRDVMTGLIAEFMQERDAEQVVYRRSEQFGSAVPCYDPNRVDSWTSAQMKKDGGKRELMRQLTDYGKKHGLFTGTTQTKAATVGADIPGGFLEVLSSMMRVSSRPGYVFWQFPTTVHNFARGEGEAVKIPRAAYPTRLTSSTQRLLSGSGTYTAIDNSNVRVATGTVNFLLKEYGRGRPEAPPIGIPTFVEAFSMIPLMPILERDLWYDYYSWEDLIIREQWRPTSQVFYSNGDQLVSTAAGVTVGGTMTRKLLSALFTWFHSNRVVPLPDGNYGIVIPPQGREQLRNDLDKYWQTPTPEQIQVLTNMLLADYPLGEDVKISGYLGNYEGFHVWTTNAYGVGASGQEGVLQETNGDSTQSIFRDSYGFGGYASGRGMGGSGAQIIFDEKTDFGRIDRAIWHAYESHGPLDVDATGYNDTQAMPQETRVVKLKTLDVALT